MSGFGEELNTVPLIDHLISGTVLDPEAGRGFTRGTDQISISCSSHTHTHTLVCSLVVRLPSDAVDQALVGDDRMAVDLQRKLFGLAPPHLPEGKTKE